MARGIYAGRRNSPERLWAKARRTILSESEQPAQDVPKDHGPKHRDRAHGQREERDESEATDKARLMSA
jgi:hypothetical protein